MHSTSDYGERVKEVREAGKYYGTVSGILQGVYFAAISFSDLRSSVQPSESWFFFLPLICWIVTLIVSFWVMRPEPSIDRWSDQDKQLRDRLTERRQWLKFSEIAFFAGLWVMVGAIVYYFFFIQILPVQPTTIVITPCP